MADSTVYTAKRLSVVVPCYKDEKNIEELYRRLKLVLKRVAPDHEILYVNDASPDDSQKILEGLAEADKQLKVIRHSRNFGLMAVYSHGMRLATGDAIVLMDGDLEDPPELIEEFIKWWQEGYLVVFGQHPDRDVSRFKKWCFTTFYRLWNALADCPIPRDAGDFSLMDRKVVSIINALPEKDRFLRGLRAWVGFPQKAVLFKRHKRFAGVSTQSYRSYVSWAIFAITSFSTVPLRAVTLFACFMTLLTMLFLGFFLALYAFNVRGPEGFLSTIAIVLMVGSGMFICQAILAEYILRIYKEVKNRSEFILESAMNNPGSLAQANEPDPKATN